MYVVTALFISWQSIFFLEQGNNNDSNEKTNKEGGLSGGIITILSLLGVILITAIGVFLKMRWCPSISGEEDDDDKNVESCCPPSTVLGRCSAWTCCCKKDKDEIHEQLTLYVK